MVLSFPVYRRVINRFIWVSWKIKNKFVILLINWSLLPFIAYSLFYKTTYIMSIEEMDIFGWQACGADWQVMRHSHAIKDITAAQDSSGFRKIAGRTLGSIEWGLRRYVHSGYGSCRRASQTAAGVLPNRRSLLTALSTQIVNKGCSAACPPSA